MEVFDAKEAVREVRDVHRMLKTELGRFPNGLELLRVLRDRDWSEPKLRWLLERLRVRPRRDGARGTLMN